MAKPKQKRKRKNRRPKPKPPVSPLDKYVPEESDEAPGRLSKDDLKWLL